MKQRSVLLWIIATVVVLIAVTLGLRQYMLHGLRSVSADVGLARAEAQAFTSRNAASTSQAAMIRRAPVFWYRLNAYVCFMHSRT